MPEIEHFNIGVEAFGEYPIALFTICSDHQFQGNYSDTPTPINSS